MTDSLQTAEDKDSDEIDQGTASLAESTRLLLDSDPSQWRRPFVQLLRLYIQPVDLRRTVEFLINMISDAVDKRGDPSEDAPVIRIDETLKPPVFDVDSWRLVVLGLGFQIEEPDTNQRTALISLIMTQQVTMASLRGFRYLLQTLLNLSNGLLAMLLWMDTSEGLGFHHAIRDIEYVHLREKHQPVISNMFARYREPMQSLGFYQDRKSSADVLWTNHNIELWESISNIYYILFGEISSPVQETSL